MKVALYARVSTNDKGQNPEMQLAEMREYCARRDLQMVGEYCDRGVSGTRESRPELDRMMKDARRRRFDAVLVWKLDRWARSLRFLVVSLADLQALGVAFISLRDNLDLSTPSGRLMFHVIGAMAEFERSLTVERVLAGLAHAKAHGKRLGRPALGVDGCRVMALRSEGKTWPEVAAVLGVSRITAIRAARAVSKTPLHEVA
jgi:DNA invertase Pin-like site-specific DNA recombinase